MTKPITTLLLLFAATALVALGSCLTPQYQYTYNLGTRDVGYSSALVDGDKIIITGPSTSPVVGGTGTDFFTLCVNQNDGSTCSTFGNGGVVRVDFDNVGGSSRTDVATELVYISSRDAPSACPVGCVALLGESVVSPAGQPTNLTFAVAMLDAVNGQLKPQFGNAGKALYDVEKGANDEIFFGALSVEGNGANKKPYLFFGGFVNPTTITGAAPSFNCGLMKVDAVTGQRISDWGQNGQVVIDFNGYDERRRSGLIVGDNFVVGGRSRPASQSVDPSDANNFRATLAKLSLDSGLFDASYGPVDTPFGLGRTLLNLNNGSFELIKSHLDGNKLFSIGNWGGWDNGVSGNKAIGIIRWEEDDGGLDRKWSNGGISHLAPAAGQSFDVYDFAFHRQFIYVVGGVKATAASSSLPTAMIVRFHTSSGNYDSQFGLQLYEPIIGATSSLFRSIIVDGNDAYLSGEVGFSSTEYDVLVAKYRL